MTLAESGEDPWRFLRDGSNTAQRAIRLVVHGRSQGVVPPCISQCADRLQERRSAPVQLEVLTSDDCVPPPSEPVWLIPLLLMPGSHVRIDLPVIRCRLAESQPQITLLPFLGAWPVWWSLVRRDLARVAARSDLILIHHPLRSGVADRFLTTLAQRLGHPLIAFEDWPAYAARVPHAKPFPLVLAPNRMSAELSPPAVAAPLLERPLLRDGLIDLLAALP